MELKHVVDFDSLKGIYNQKFSCERQDEFVYHLYAKYKKEPGFFLDVGCGAGTVHGTPMDASNTFVLEKYLEWDGFGFDIGDVEENNKWSTHRTSGFYQIDATSRKFTNILQELVGDRVVDYISLDVDAGDDIFAHVALERILDAGVKFKVMTLEHELFKHGELVTFPTRTRLKSLGYEILFENVSHPGGNAFEDWWVDPNSMLLPDIMDLRACGLGYNECIGRVVEHGKTIENR